MKSYSLVNPSRLVIDVYNSKLNSEINEAYNFPVRKISATSEEGLTRIVIDLYEFVRWEKPVQIKTDKGILLNLVISKDKKLKKNTRDIVIGIDAGHGGKDPGNRGNGYYEKNIVLNR